MDEAAGVRWRMTMVRTYLLLPMVALTVACTSWSAPGTLALETPSEQRRLVVSENGRYLVYADGTPFFWMADTAWELFYRLNRNDAATYLNDRRQKGFTVILSVALSYYDDTIMPNEVHRHSRLIDRDPARPNVTAGSDPNDPDQYDYWDHVEYVIRLADEMELYIGLLPAWGTKIFDPERSIFSEEGARRYGRFLGERYGQYRNIVWVLGGDVPARYEGRDITSLWREMAAGIEQGAAGSVLMTYHPSNTSSSAQWFHSEPWLDFNMIQSGHSRRDLENWRMIEHDYQRSPVKPVVDAEPNYEDTPIGWDPANGHFRDDDVRKQAYRSVFAGAFGVTYGHASVWQMYLPERPTEPQFRPSPDISWSDALNRPGATQLIHLRNLLESRPFLTRVPDQQILASDPDSGARHVRATRSADGSYAMVYIPTAEQSISVRMSVISGGPVQAWWYDPRTSAASAAGEFANAGTQTFVTPVIGPDWVLVLEDGTKGFPPPGTVDRQ